MGASIGKKKKRKKNKKRKCTYRGGMKQRGKKVLPGLRED